MGDCRVIAKLIDNRVHLGSWSVNPSLGTLGNEENAYAFVHGFCPQELSEHLGLRKLNERLSDPEMQDYFDGVFPKDNPKNTRFAINFFTSIGLGGLTDILREYLKIMPRLIMNQHKPVESESDVEGLGSETSGGGSSSESEPDSSDSESSERDSDDSQDEKERKRRKRK
jgi:pre-mRNA-splicing factor CWC22